MVEEREARLRVLRNLLGDWGPGVPSISVEENYLAREKIENAKELGYAVPEEDLPTGGVEKDWRRHIKMMQQLEAERCPRFVDSKGDIIPYDGREARATWKQKRAIYRIAKMKGEKVDEWFMECCTFSEASSYIQELLDLEMKMEIVEL